MEPRPADRLVRFELSPKSIGWLFLAAGSVWLLIKLWPLVLVLIVALMLVGTMGPAVEWVESKGFGRRVGIAVVFVAFLMVVVVILTVTVPALVTQAAAFLDQEPALRANLAARLSQSHLTEPLGRWLVNAKFDAAGADVATMALAVSTRVLEIVAYAASAIFLALYIMIDRDRLRGALFAVLPRTHHIRLSRVLLNLETIVGAYIRGQVITSALMAVFTFALLTSCGIQGALALAVLAGVADVLPYIGVFLSVGPAVLAALSHGPGITITVLVLMLVYEEFESRVLVPRIYGRALRLPSSVVLFALLAGGLLMGVLGAILALPVAAGLMMLIEELRVELPGAQARVDDVGVREGDTRAEEEYQRRTEGVRVEEAAAIAVEISSDRQKTEDDAADVEAAKASEPPRQ